MKARPCDRLFKESQIKEQVEKFITKRYDEIAVDISSQLIAVVLVMLDKEYGFKKKRLKRFMANLQEQAEFVSVGDVIGKKVSTVDCVEYIKKRYDIDLYKEIGKM